MRRDAGASARSRGGCGGGGAVRAAAAAGAARSSGGAPRPGRLSSPSARPFDGRAWPAGRRGGRRAPPCVRGLGRQPRARARASRSVPRAPPPRRAYLDVPSSYATVNLPMARAPLAPAAPPCARVQSSLGRVAPRLAREERVGGWSDSSGSGKAACARESTSRKRSEGAPSGRAVSHKITKCEKMLNISLSRFCSE